MANTINIGNKYYGLISGESDGPTFNDNDCYTFSLANSKYLYITLGSEHDDESDVSGWTNEWVYTLYNQNGDEVSSGFRVAKDIEDEVIYDGKLDSGKYYILISGGIYTGASVYSINLQERNTAPSPVTPLPDDSQQESSQDASKSPVWERLAGQSALDTGKVVVEAANAFTAGRGGTVIVATSDGYWDALAAAGLAGTTDAPVLITSGASLSGQTREEIQRLQPSRIFVMGGRAAISEACYEEIRSLVNNTERVSGPDAVETSVAIYEKGSGWGNVAIVATSSGYWDALSIAPFAWAKKAPIFLTGAGNRLTESVLSAIRRGGFTEVIIVGGKAVVSGDVENQLSEFKVTRLKGANAIATSAAIANWEISRGMSIANMAIATSSGYWDALTGAALCGKLNSVLVLVSESDRQAFDAVYSRDGVQHGYVFGGRAAISDETYAYVTEK